jgi:hypothetical protein
MKKRSLLARLRINGSSYLISALLLLIGVPLYQSLVLNPMSYGATLAALRAGQETVYLGWIASHGLQFAVYRILLIIPFALLLSLPFALFRIIVAQELMRQIDQQEQSEHEAQKAQIEESEDGNDQQTQEEEEIGADGLPAHAWRGKGFVIIAAWTGIAGLVLYVLGAAIELCYLLIAGNSFSASHSVTTNFSLLSSIFNIIVNTIGIGLLALSTLFFGAMIARSGRTLWPGIWVIFGYMALAVAALLSGSAVAVAGAPMAGQAALTTPAILLLGLWVLWLGIMLLRLRPES